MVSSFGRAPALRSFPYWGASRRNRHGPPAHWQAPLHLLDYCTPSNIHGALDQLRQDSFDPAAYSEGPAAGNDLTITL